jgi:hypothetical protein
MASARPSCSMRAAVMLLASAELTVAERPSLRGLARASNASDRRLQSCGSATFVADSTNCPSDDLQNCYDSVACGDLCEGDDECGTDGNLDNCGGYDVYRRDCPTSTDGNFVYVSQNKYWSDARTYCRANYHDLASIHSASENAAVNALCPGQCWIGGSDSAREDTWTWSDGSTWDYQNWHSDEPNDSWYGEDYLEIYSDGKWNDHADGQKPFVCSTTASPTATPATGFVHVSSTETYSDALSYCRTYHIELASIHSSIENAAVAALCTYDCWIGGSDEASEGTWTWSDSSAWNYQNWKTGEPRTSSSSYDYLAIRSDGEWYATYYAYSGSKTFVCSTTTPPSSSSSSDKDKDQEDNTGVVVGIFCALALAAAWGFHVYRNKKIKRSRGLKREIKRMNNELNTYKNAAVGMRVAVTAAGPSAPAAGPVTWYWEESPARLELHPIVKDPHWIPYDAATTNLLEKNYQSGAGTVVLSAAYHADTKTMTQKNVRTGFSRKLLRFEPPASKGAAPPIKPDGIAADEPCLVLDPGAMMLIAKKREDGWAFGSVVLEGEATSPSSPGPGWSKNQGWFRMDNTDIPTVDQLADFRDAVQGGEDALAVPKYWDDVKDPTVAQYFRITSKTHADEYERVLGAFMLTLDPSTSQCIHQIVAARLAESAPDSLIDLRTGAFTIHSVDRVQNLSLWKTYAAKRAATCSREEDPEKARRRFVRAWLFHGCSSVWKSTSASGAPHGAAGVASMAWRLT